MNKEIEIEFTDEEQSMLECHACGMKYNHILQFMANKYNWDKNNKRLLGYRMGELKRKMECNTQFQMGYFYAADAFRESIKKNKSVFDKHNEQWDIMLMHANKRGQIKGIKKGASFSIIISFLFALYIIFTN